MPRPWPPNADPWLDDGAPLLAQSLGIDALERETVEHVAEALDCSAYEIRDSYHASDGWGVCKNWL